MTGNPFDAGVFDLGAFDAADRAGTGGRSFSILVSATDFGTQRVAFDDVFDPGAFDVEAAPADVLIYVSRAAYAASVSTSALSIEVS